MHYRTWSHCDKGKEKLRSVFLGMLYAVFSTDKPLQVYSPYQRNWLAVLNSNTSYYLENYPKPHANSKSTTESEKFAPLFDTSVPASVHGFELEAADSKIMQEVWPAGEDTAENVASQIIEELV